ncbi:MAG TPA: protein-disulfide reductase DsbD family protein [Candidatus Saccharicenans sp.]|nr:protein-disulfide reductase DsbD family protein [Candidatus Saccharicenans sp.]
MRLRSRSCAFLFGLLLVGSAYSQSISLSSYVSQEKTKDEEPIVTVKVLPLERPVRPGQVFELSLELHILPGFHINSEKPGDELLVPTSIELENKETFEIKEIIFPEPQVKKFKFATKPLSVYEGQVEVKLKIELKPTVKESTVELAGKVRYQACNDEACLRPTRLPFKATLQVAGNTSSNRR